MEDLVAQLMAIFVPAIVAVAGILVTWGLAELRKLIKTKTDNAAAVQAFDTVEPGRACRWVRPFHWNNKLRRQASRKLR